MPIRRGAAMWERLKQATSTEGRAHQITYWRTVLPAWLAAIVVALVMAIVDAFLGLRPSEWIPPGFGGAVERSLFALIYIYLAWVTIAVSIRRLHDRDKTGWWVIPLVCLPAGLRVFDDDTHGVVQSLVDLIEVIFGGWGFIEIGLSAGTPGDN